MCALKWSHFGSDKIFPDPGWPLLFGSFVTSDRNNSEYDFLCACVSSQATDSQLRLHLFLNCGGGVQAAKKNEASIAVHLTGCFLHINLHFDESPTLTLSFLLWSHNHYTLSPNLETWKGEEKPALDLWFFCKISVLLTSSIGGIVFVTQCRIR